ncbi:MAG: hypothetical protein AAF577_05955 [Pseudomonadota bacterium]
MDSVLNSIPGSGPLVPQGTGERRAAPQTDIPPAPVPTAAMVQAGRDFEAAFLAEMLRHTGLDSLGGRAGGGMAEGQLAPMLTRAIADRLASTGGLGIAPLVTARLAAAGEVPAARLEPPGEIRALDHRIPLATPGAEGR